jgi:hypothetical protein
MPRDPIHGISRHNVYDEASYCRRDESHCRLQWVQEFHLLKIARPRSLLEPNSGTARGNLLKGDKVVNRVEGEPAIHRLR